MNWRKYVEVMELKVLLNIAWYPVLVGVERVGKDGADMSRSQPVRCSA